MPAWLTVVGIGDDGFAGLGRSARRALLEASVVYGGERHLAMLPARLAARRARVAASVRSRAVARRAWRRGVRAGKR